ncbi:MAG: hypothetical protein ABI594_17025 [Ginsengibacter sp.]
MTEAKKNPFINNKKEDYLQTHEKSQRGAIRKTNEGNRDRNV